MPGRHRDQLADYFPVPPTAQLDVEEALHCLQPLLGQL